MWINIQASRKKFHCEGVSLHLSSFPQPVFVAFGGYGVWLRTDQPTQLGYSGVVTTEFLLQSLYENAKDEEN